ncbi:MAG TPA: hypothetical protein VES69_02785 [Pyrinomonadaceae bacterium]|nr:hypothetical protein [Pyrinomonadaceae bacterium]
MPRINLIAPILILLILPGSTNSQPAVHARQIPNGLVLEVVYLKDTAPAYQALSRSSGGPARTWYGRFSRIQNWQLPAGELPVRAVNIVAGLDGDVAFVSVSVLRGVKFHDQETMVGKYQLRENDRISVQELELFGVKPFRISLKRITPPVLNQPVVKSLAKSVEIVGIEPQTSTLPRYKLTLRNLSDKNIMAISIKVVGGGLGVMSSMPQGREGLPLIRAGAFFDSIEPLKTRSVQTPGGFTPDLPTSQETVIMAAVFEDGSYEGDPADSAAFKALTFGRKRALTRLLEIIRADRTVLSEEETPSQVSVFKNRVRTISDDIDEATLAQLMRELPSVAPKEKTRMRIAAEAGMHQVMKELLDNLAAVEKDPPPNFRSWLANVEERYQTWLARL